MANVLKTRKRVAVVEALGEANSIRRAVRLTGMAKGRMMKLLDPRATRSTSQDEVLRTCPQQSKSMRFGPSATREPPRGVAGTVAYGDVWSYVFVRPHKTLSNPYPKTSAMATLGGNHVWRVEEIVALLDQTSQSDPLSGPLVSPVRFGGFDPSSP